ncbi:MAG: cytochrome c biogenesis CcdA family protein [Thermoleophilaceae bacterium]
MNAPIALAFGAGLLATVNPCGLALLPSFLGLYLGSSEDGAAERSLLARAAQGFLVGAVLSASFGAVFVMAGLIVSAGLRSFIDIVPWLAAAIGAALVVLGFAIVAGRRVALVAASRVRVGSAATGGYRRVAAFGITYALASLSCTLAVFLAVVGQALAAADPLRFVAVFAAYAAGSATVLIALSLSAALAKGALARAVRKLVPLVNRLAGALLAASGAYLILYWLPVLGGATVPDSPLIRFSASLSSSLSAFFSQHTTDFALGLGALLALGVAALALERRRRSAGAPRAGIADEASPPDAWRPVRARRDDRAPQALTTARTDGP